MAKQAEPGDGGQWSSVQCPASLPVLIIGYGNPLRGDDGVGWYVAEYLAQTMQLPHVQVVCCHQLTPELAAMISHVELVVFIDAAVADPGTAEKTAGRICCQAVTDLPQSRSRCSHHFTPPILLEYTRLLYNTRPSAFLLTVTGGSFAYTERLSPAVYACLPDIYNTISALIAAAASTTDCAYLP